MKLLYDFKFTTPSGKELHLAIKKPSRLEIDDADMMYSKFLSEAIQKGIMTKEMLLKTYKNFGGILSSQEEKEYAKIFSEFVSTQKRLDQAKTKKEKAECQKELEVFYTALKDIEMEHENLFSRTADVIARNNTINHLSLLLALVNKGSQDAPDWTPLYLGDEYEDRYQSFAESEEVDSREAHAILAKISVFVTFWYFNPGEVSLEDFKAYDELISKDLNGLFSSK